MIIKEVLKKMDDWAPGSIAWERDNVGLQVGNPALPLKNIMLALDMQQNVLTQAAAKKCNLIITHHPLLFNPIKKITPATDKTSSLIQQLILKNITLASYHTNLDFTKDGVSLQLAKKIGLTKIQFLSPIKTEQCKLVLFVPKNYLEKVSQSLFDAGAGRIGEYSNCSFRLNGEGTFFGSEDANPAIGKKGKLEKVEEVRVEMVFDKWNMEKIIEALSLSHPYEEPAYDIYSIQNKNKNFGIGAIGEFDSPVSAQEFLQRISSKLKSNGIRYSKTNIKEIKRVAVCGGSGSELLNDALAAKADALITADIKYHTFQDAEDKILLIDAGHFETEAPVLDEVKKRLEKVLEKKSNKVFIYRGEANPVKYFFNNSKEKIN